MVKLQQKKLFETTRFDGYRANTSALSNVYVRDKVDRLKKLEASIEGLELTETLVNEIDHLVCNHPIVGFAYVQAITACDTPTVTTVELSNKEDSELVLAQVDARIPQLFAGVANLHELSKHIDGLLLRYGIYAAQPVFSKGSTLERFVEPCPQTIKFWRKAGQWQMIQSFRGEVIEIDQDFFVFESLYPLIKTDAGIWWKCPFKAAVLPAAVYNLFVDSLGQITRDSGVMSKLGIGVDYKYLQQTVENDIDPSLGKKYAQDALNQAHVKLSGDLRSGSRAGFLMYDKDTFPNGIQKIDESKPSDSIYMLHELIATSVAMGCMTFASNLGVFGKENQTTQSTVHKLIVAQNQATIQATRNEIIKKILMFILTDLGKIVVSIDRQSEPPHADSNLELELAREKRLTNDLLQIQLDKAIIQP